MTDLPDGFEFLKPKSTRVIGETELGIRIYKNGVLAMSKPLMKQLPRDRFPRLVVGANRHTGEVYIGPAGDQLQGTYANCSQINADAVREYVRELNLEYGGFYRAMRKGNGFSFSSLTKR